MRIKETNDQIISIVKLRAIEAVAKVEHIVHNEINIDRDTYLKITKDLQSFINDESVSELTQELFLALVMIREYSAKLKIREKDETKVSEYQLINTLCESRLFRTKEALGRYSSREKAELFYSILLSTIALAQDTKTSTWAQEYASSASAFANFDYFRTSGNDLYVLSYSLQNELMILSAAQAQVLIRLYRSIGRGNVERGLIQQTLLRLERMLNVGDARLRNARRVIVNWSDSSPIERKTSLVQLHRFIRARGRLAEVLPYILVLSKDDKGHFGKMTPLKKAAALVGAGLAGLALGLRYDPNKRWSVFKKESIDLDNNEALTEDRPTQLFNLVQNLKAHPDIEEIVGVNYLADGISAFVRTTDGNAYEMEIRPARYAKGHQAKRRVSEGWDWSIIGEDTDEEFIAGDVVEYNDLESGDQDDGSFVIGSGRKSRRNNLQGQIIFTPAHLQDAGLYRVMFDGRDRSSTVSADSLTLIKRY